eukprot:NODE_5856_length_601_cov_41.029536_g5691_i0.p2 GENE.NODE_5856_length_601_cov_41.029536_g5691_i0~~NODE_5856_length_601_cov_41.029536_g5691_i0.p2  ORF type:complete len:177 (-),score=50.61 NODE_5856_length_601_cov_41.029536_g5691_i0:70-546(-)
MPSVIPRKWVKSNARKKVRKAHFNAPSHVRRIIMSSRLSNELRKKHNVRAVPIRKDDEVKVMVGIHKGREGKVVTCYRKKWVIHIDKITREKANGTPVPIGIHPSNVRITKLRLDKCRKMLLKKKANPTGKKPKAREALKGSKTKKVKSAEVAMQDVD